jgi:hypothetical protein
MIEKTVKLFLFPLNHNLMELKQKKDKIRVLIF